MLSSAVFLLLIGASYASPTHQKIVNGTNAAEGEFPYIISLRDEFGHICGGSILSESYVVTAAHCVSERNPSTLTIQYGVVEISPDGINRIEVDAIAVHELYSPGNGHKNDIAVLKLKAPIPLSDRAKPVKLPEPEQIFEDRPTATLIGWGLPYSGGNVMTHLQKVDIFLYMFEDCERAHGSLVDELCHVCAGVPEGGKGQCSGDSGGPLTVDGVLVGTVSWSVKPCTIAGFPGVFARVAHYVDWIQKTMKMLN